MRGLGVLKNWIDQGSLAAVRVGRRVRIRREDFQALIDQGYSASRPQTRGFDAQAFWDGEPMPLPDLVE